ncbi:MAG: hypothetical protein JXR11_09790 [Balneola sp.]
MKISASYKSISTLLSLSIILSFTVSLCSMSTMEEMCEQMMMNHSSMDMAEMDHDAGHQDMMQSNHTSESSECEMTVDCDCMTDKNLIATIAPIVVLKINTPTFSFTFEEISSVESDHIPRNSDLTLTNSYSPPPLFLANESFLI